MHDIGAVCLKEGSDKLSLAVDESEVDGNKQLMDSISNMISPTKAASISLEHWGVMSEAHVFLHARINKNNSRSVGSWQILDMTASFTLL